MTHRELGGKILKKLTADLIDLADVEVYPKMEGYQMFTILSPKKAKIPTVTKHTSVAPNKEDEPEKPKKAAVKKPIEKAKEEPKDDDEIF